ncbi:hypothetical protein [Dongia sedimenti]|uniref:Uncharacterized protein n=1 Tax=Dongia sedimenti TaxID=3064282 RepID=A0ABU0YN60_9PROT|nr:hypothetical protein [Rhodospirillaceae bacterium R-7]
MPKPSASLSRSHKVAEYLQHPPRQNSQHQGEPFEPLLCGMRASAVAPPMGARHARQERGTGACRESRKKQRPHRGRLGGIGGFVCSNRADPHMICAFIWWPAVNGKGTGRLLCDNGQNGDMTYDRTDPERIKTVTQLDNGGRFEFILHEYREFPNTEPFPSDGALGDRRGHDRPPRQ